MEEDTFELGLKQQLDFRLLGKLGKVKTKVKDAYVLSFSYSHHISPLSF